MTGEAKKFYQRAGFRESPLDPMTMMINGFGALTKAIAP